MGFELIYHFREEESPGNYSSEIKNKTIRVGKYHEDTSLESVAAKIMSQMARRNILIEDVEIFEYTKKQLSFKQNDESIIIKNKKYRFDDGPVCHEDNVTEEPNLEALIENILAKKINSQPQSLYSKDYLHPNKPEKPSNLPPPPPQNTENGNVASLTVLKKEYFDPELLEEHKAKSMGLKLTKGNQYKIVGVEGSGALQRYYVLDDNNKKIKADAMWFVATKTPNLQPMDDGLTESNDSIDLWDGLNTEDTLDISKLRR